MDILVPALTEREMKAMARRAMAQGVHYSTDGAQRNKACDANASAHDADAGVSAARLPPNDITPEMLAAAVKVYRYWAGKDAESVCREILHHALKIAPASAAPRTPVEFKVKVLRARAADLKHRALQYALNDRRLGDMTADAEHMGEAANMLEYFARTLALTRDAHDRLDAKYVALLKGRA